MQRHDSGGGAAQFETRGGDNSIEEFGEEAAPAGLAAAASGLHGYLDARAAGEWHAACSHMAAGVTASLRRLAAGGGGEASCPKLLRALSASLPAATLREAASADVGALRREGDRGFLLYTGAHHSDYMMPMAREGGDWKVAAIAPSSLS